MATTTSTAAIPSDTDADSSDGQTAVQKLRDQADAVVQRIQPQIAAVATYAREEPVKALLISAAAGAALMGLVALLVRSGGGRSQAPGLSAMAAIREAALDLADSAQTMAADALDAAQKRAVAALETTQKRASAATESVSESMADALKRVREQAGPVVDRIKPQLDAAAAYAKEEPARAALGLAAAGAIVAGLIALARHAQDDSTA
jgi:ElaB/YqjD/DUF883 family membrane-anchored ribosome-binding protein